MSRKMSAESMVHSPPIEYAVVNPIIVYLATVWFVLQLFVPIRLDFWEADWMRIQEYEQSETLQI
jgi:hypothetical protein